MPHFAQRLLLPKTVNQLSLLYEKKRKNQEQLSDLTLSNPTKANFVYDEKTLLAALSSKEALQYHPIPQGLKHCRTAIADYYAEQSIAIDSENLFITSSTSEAYAFLFKLLTVPGEEIMIPQPSYPLFEMLLQLEGVTSIPYPIKYHNDAWHIDTEYLRTCISTKTKAIVLVNPNNPTGSYLKKSEIKALNSICTDFNVSLIVDEVFFDYPTNIKSTSSTTAITNGDSLTFVLSGFSKILGLPQMKLSWFYINGPESMVREARNQLEFIADAYLSVSTPIQCAAPLMLTTKCSIQSQIQERINKNYFQCTQLAQESAHIEVLPREAGWYAVIRVGIPERDEILCIELLRDYNVYIHPGILYDFSDQNHLVLSLLTPEDQFSEALTKIKHYFSIKERFSSPA